MRLHFMATVLVVDDHAPTRRALGKLLRGEGYAVLPASDAFEAMAAAKRLHPDLILLDVQIPPMDGLTFLMLLRENMDTVPVILLTGLSDAQTLARANELGVKEYLVKSQYTTPQLLALVKKYTAGAKGAAGREAQGVEGA
jgi:CheY-like chemotaxis protein